ncbi:unnamed protein product [Caenorhabditis brenneri]
MEERQMRYPCIRSIIQYIDINVRIQLVQRCPSLRSLNKAVPISARYMFFGFSRIIINSTVYQMGIYRDCANNCSAPIQQFLRENQEGGICYDIDEYGERDYALDRLINPGDVFIPSPYPSEERTPEEEDQYIETLRERLASLKQLRRIKERKQEIELIESKILTWQQKREPTGRLPFTPYLQFTITKPNGTTIIERMVYGKKLYEAIEYLYDKFFGRRKHPIRIGNLKISSTGGVLRLPEFMKVRVRELFMGSNVDEVMKAFVPIMIENYTPEDIGVIDGESLAMNYEHPIIKAARVFIINRTPVTGQLFHIILDNTNERLDVQNGQNSIEELVMLTEKVARDMRHIGTCYSFGIHSRQIVKLFFKEMKEKPRWRSTIEMSRGCARFPHTLSLILNKFSVLTICCNKNERYDNSNNGMEPWILWIRVEWCMRLSPEASTRY